jgi:hypothetical protein
VPRRATVEIRSQIKLNAKTTTGIQVPVAVIAKLGSSKRCFNNQVLRVADLWAIFLHRGYFVLSENGGSRAIIRTEAAAEPGHFRVRRNC